MIEITKTVPCINKCNCFFCGGASEPFFLPEIVIQGSSCVKIIICEYCIRELADGLSKLINQKENENESN